MVKFVVWLMYESSHYAQVARLLIGPSMIKIQVRVFCTFLISAFRFTITPLLLSIPNSTTTDKTINAAMKGNGKMPASARVHSRQARPASFKIQLFGHSVTHLP